METALTIALLSFAQRFCAAGSLLLVSVALAGNEAPLPSEAANSDRNLSPTNGGWKVKCVTPGKTEVTSLTMDGAKINYALPRGVTSFIIRLAVPAQQRCITFVNENAAAEGRLSIAVANERLAADNPRWSVVDGAIRFRHKRRFALSLDGIEAHYVKLTFEVDSLEGVATRDFGFAQRGGCRARLGP
jgi:hypothetical protein